MRAGIAFIPFAFGLGAAASVASKLAVKVQPRWLVLTGVVIMIVGLLYGSTLDSDSTYLANLFVPVIGIGFGIGLAMVPLPLCAIAGVPETEIGPLTAIAQVAQTLGGPLALSVIGAMATSKTLSLGGTSGKAADMNPAQFDRTRRGIHLRTCGLRGLRRVRRYRGAVHQVHTFSGSPGTGCGEGSSGNRLISPVFPLR